MNGIVQKFYILTGYYVLWVDERKRNSPNAQDFRKTNKYIMKTFVLYCIDEYSI